MTLFGYTGKYKNNTPTDFAKSLKNIGFDVLFTANSHCLDFGYDGLKSTLEQLDELDISHIGTARSTEEQSSVLIKDINGIKIGFISYTFETDSKTIPDGKNYCVNLINKEAISSEIERLKLKGVDVICANMHWGKEYGQVYNSTQEELCNFLFENGVDIVLGTHPQLLQNYEKKTFTMADGTQKDVFVIYSLGNFISTFSTKNTDTSIILNIEISKDSNGKISIDNADYIPVYKANKYGKDKKYTLLDINKSISDYKNNLDENITSDTYSKLENSLEFVQKLYNQRTSE